MLYRQSLIASLAIFAVACATAGTPDDGTGDDPTDPDASIPMFPDPDPDASMVDPGPDAATPQPDAPIAQVDCTEDTTLSCGDVLEHSLFFADASISGYSCETLATDGVENIYTFTPPTTGSVTITLDVLEDTPIFEDDFDLYVLENTCSLSTCITQSAQAGDESLTFTATGGVTYFVVVEAFNVGLVTLRDYDLSVTCP